MNRRYMKLLATPILLGAMLLLPATPSIAQKKPTKPRVRYYTVNAGNTMRVRLNGDLGSEKGYVGQTFTSTLVDPLYSNNGVVVAPPGSTVTGHVTQVQRARKNGEPASMDVAFTSLKLPNGRVHRINGSLTDLSADSGTKSDNEGTMTAKKTSKRKLKFIGGGAAGGAVIGAIAGGGKGLAIGAGVGAIAGAVTGRVKKGSEVKVKSGTEFGVILNVPVSLQKYAAL